MRYRSEPNVERIIHMATAHKTRRRDVLEGDYRSPNYRGPLTRDQWADLDVMGDIDLAVATGEPHWVRAYGLETA